MRLFLLIAAICFQQLGLGNNPQLSEVQLHGRDSLVLELSWENAWCNSLNHDAVWLFFKYRQGNDPWAHLHLDTTATSAAILQGTAGLKLPADGVGILVQTFDSGVFSVQSLKLQLKIAAELPIDCRGLMVEAIEMVHVPTGSFELGDGGSIGRLGSGDSLMPFTVGSEAAITVGKGSGELFAALDSPAAPLIPAGYPKGYAGFYQMKYEINQGQYMRFLNSLDFRQQSERFVCSPDAESGTPVLGEGTSSRNALVILEPGHAPGQPAIVGLEANSDGYANGVYDASNRACNRLTWSDLCAYLDWAALRPMSEFEFEKSCRGHIPALAGEFAFGSDEVSDAESLIADGGPDEGVTDPIAPGSGLANHGSFNPSGTGSLRNGFAAKASTDRLSAGASVYGAMELSGNLWEQLVHCGSASTTFDHTHGDGNLNADGESDIANWRPQSGDCAGHRGGGWQSAIWEEFRDLAVSDRYYIFLNPNLLRRNTVGGRGVRSF